MKSIESVQIIGTQRSGSNLLRLMLNQIEGVFAPHPPHILATFYELLPGYGNLDKDNNFRALIDDICTLVELNPVTWESLFADRQVIFKACKYRSLEEIFRVIYELNAKSHQSDIWICKSMQNVKYLKNFESIGLSPKLIYLYRDGRDVALSFKKTIVGPKHIYSIAKKWSEEQELSLNAAMDYGEEMVLSLSYESLIQEPERQLRMVCDFLGKSYNRNVLDYYTSDESKRTADAGEMWSNLKNPIIRNNSNKYVKELSHDEINIFEHIAGNELKKLKYRTNFNSKNSAFKLSEELISQFDKDNLVLQLNAKRNASKKDLRKRGAQDDFVKGLKKRMNINAV